MLGRIETSLESLLVFFRAAVPGEGKLGLCENDGDRGAHFMGGVGGKPDLVLEGGFEFFKGVIEDFGNLAEFTFRFADVDAAREVSLGDSVGGF